MKASRPRGDGPPELTPEKAFIFRITHVDNVPHILDHGLCSRSNERHNPNFVNIGNAELIEKRRRWTINVPPWGTLSDYVPFYFTPHSKMLANIHTGYNAERRKNAEIVIFVASLHDLVKKDCTFIFTTQHANSIGCKYLTNVSELERIDWRILQARDFKTDMNDPQKGQRYMAEALVHRTLPVSGMLGIACFDQGTTGRVKKLVDNLNLPLHVACRPGWYFR